MYQGRTNARAASHSTVVPFFWKKKEKKMLLYVYTTYAYSPLAGDRCFLFGMRFKKYQHASNPSHAQSRTPDLRLFDWGLEGFLGGDKGCRLCERFV